jgi:hypothetical protein
MGTKQNLITDSAFGLKIINHIANNNTAISILAKKIILKLLELLKMILTSEKNLIPLIISTAIALQNVIIIAPKRQMINKNTITKEAGISTSFIV